MILPTKSFLLKRYQAQIQTAQNSALFLLNQVRQLIRLSSNEARLSKPLSHELSFQFLITIFLFNYFVLVIYLGQHAPIYGCF